MRPEKGELHCSGFSFPVDRAACKRTEAIAQQAEISVDLPYWLLADSTTEAVQLQTGGWWEISARLRDLDGPGACARNSWKRVGSSGVSVRVDGQLRYNGLPVAWPLGPALYFDPPPTDFARLLKKERTATK